MQNRHGISVPVCLFNLGVIFSKLNFVSILFISIFEFDFHKITPKLDKSKYCAII